MTSDATSAAADPFGLARFLEAQQGVIESAMEELAAGAKRGHWMWFVFPQLAGLGHSAMARRYGISGLPEAIAYLAHPVLGARLAQCCALVTAAASRPGGRSAEQMLGSVDAMKLRSCLTLFAAAFSAAFGKGGDEADTPYRAALERLFAGAPDPHTFAALSAPGPGAAERASRPPA